MGKLSLRSIEESLERENDDYSYSKRVQKIKPKVRKMRNKD